MLKRLDELVIKELVGPWLFGVAMFTVLIMAASYLFKASDFLVQGVGGLTVIQYILLNLPGIMVKTFAMAVLLASLLAFGRLSGDSEIIAIRAAGVSVYRIMRPVALFSFVVAIIAFGIDETLVPAASMQTLRMEAEIAKNLKGTVDRVTGYPIEEKGELKGIVTARSISVETRTMTGAVVSVYGKDLQPDYYLSANQMEFDPKQFASGGGWRIRGGATLTSRDGRNVLTIDNEAWPPQVPSLTASPFDILTDKVSNLDVFSMAQIRREIKKEQLRPKPRANKIANYEYGYWNKIALPLAALIYGLLGAPLGIRNARTGTATGFALSVAIIFVYVTIGNTLNVFAMGGKIPAFVASFTPLLIGLIASGVIMWRRNA